MTGNNRNGFRERLQGLTSDTDLDPDIGEEVDDTDDCAGIEHSESTNEISDADFELNYADLLCVSEDDEYDADITLEAGNTLDAGASSPTADSVSDKDRHFYTASIDKNHLRSLMESDTSGDNNAENVTNCNDTNEQYFHEKMTEEFGDKTDDYIKSAVDRYLNSGKKEQMKKKKKKASLFSILLTVAITFAAVVVLFSFIIINANVPSGSMKDTINENDKLIGFRLAYAFSDPQRGDIVIFTPPDEDSLYIKRIIGLPGDTVKISYGNVYVNDEKLDEPYIKEPMDINSKELVYEVPDNSYFLLGDNRNNSLDSRYWSTPYITRDKIAAKAVFKYFDGQKNLPHLTLMQ